MSRKWPTGNRVNPHFDPIGTRSYIKKWGDLSVRTAAQEGNLDVVQDLIEKGVDPNKADDYGRTPIWIAARYGRLDLVEYLVGKGANPDQANNGGRTPIWIAAQKGHLNVVKYLVSEGANPDQADNYGWTPISAATHASHLNVVQYLVEEAKVDFNKATTDENWTPLDIANFDRKYKGVADYLRSIGADGWTKLLYACYEGDLNTTQQLIGSGANVNEVNNKGETPIYVAAQKGHLDVVRYLFEGANADANKANKYGETPLWIAAKWGHLDVVQYLVKKAGADPNEASKEGRTPISIAVGFWHFDVAKYLRSIGAKE